MFLLHPFPLELPQVRGIPEASQLAWDSPMAKGRLPGREEYTGLLPVAVQCWSYCQREAEGSLLAPHGQGARESQSHEDEALMPHQN